MEAGADLEEGADPAPHDDLPLGRIGDPGEDLEERALAGAVPPDDAENLAGLDLEVDVPEGLESVARRPEGPEGPDGVAEAGHDAL